MFTVGSVSNAQEWLTNWTLGYVNRKANIPKSQTSDTLVTSVNVSGDPPHSGSSTIQATSDQDPPSTQEGSRSLSTDSAPLDHQVVEVELPPTVDNLFQGVLPAEGLSFTQEPRNAAPATSIPTSVEIEPVDADNDQVVASQSSSSSAFPFCFLTVYMYY